MKKHKHRPLKEIQHQAHNARKHIIIASSIVYPLSTVPQILQIFRNQSAGEISLLTYILYAFFSAIFLIYGIRHKLKPIAIMQALWLVSYVFVITGVVLYR